MTSKNPYLQIGFSTSNNSSIGKQVNEPALRSIQRLIDEWIQIALQNASKLNGDNSIPDSEWVNEVVKNAWNQLYDNDWFL